MREEKCARQVEKMREADEYVDGIFHESIMAIQSGRGGGEWMGRMVEQGGEDLSFRRERRDVVYPSAPSRMFSIHPAGILPVFFPFPASWTRVESRGQIGSKIDECR